MCEKGKGAFKWPSLRLRLGWHTDSGRLLLEYAEAGKRQGETDTGPGGSLDPPEPLPTRFHAVYMEYSERLPTLSNPLAERACFLPGKRGAHVRSWDVLGQINLSVDCVEARNRASCCRLLTSRAHSLACRRLAVRADSALYSEWWRQQDAA